MRSGDVFDQVWATDEPAYSPTGSVKTFTGRTHGDSQGIDLRGERCYASEGCVVEPVIDFVGENDDIVLHANVTDSLEFVSRKDFTDWIVSTNICKYASGTIWIGSYGELMTIMRVFEVMADSKAGRLTAHSDDGRVSVAPFSGGVRGT